MVLDFLSEWGGDVHGFRALSHLGYIGSLGVWGLGFEVWRGFRV